MSSRKRHRARAPEPKRIIGWLERVEVRLPHSDAPPLRLRAKIDTGADASVLHAKVVKVNGRVARFSVFRRKQRKSLVHKKVTVKSSNGTREKRVKVPARVSVGGQSCPVVLSLTDRSEMEYPMLLGRDFLRQGFLVDCSRKFRLSPLRRKLTDKSGLKRRSRLIVIPNLNDC